MTVWGKTCNRLPLVFIVPAYAVLFIHPVDGYLGCFHLLAVVSNAVMNTDVQMFIQVSALCSFGYLPKSGIAGSHAYFMFPFFFFF